MTSAMIVDQINTTAGDAYVTASTNATTSRTALRKRSQNIFAENPLVKAIRLGAKNTTDVITSAPLLDGAALPLMSSVLSRQVYISGGKIWAVTTAGTTGAMGPTVGANIADPVAAGGTALFMYLGDKKTALVGDADIPTVTFVRPNTLSATSSYMVVDQGAGGAAANIGLYEYTGSLTPVIRASAAMPGRFINTSSWYGSTSVPSLIGYDQQQGRSIGFATRSKRVFIANPGNYAPALYGVEINGKPLYDLGVFNANNALAGGNSGMLLTFSTRELRTIWVTMPYDAEFSGVVVDSGEKISKPLVSDVRITVEGDSLTEAAASPGAFHWQGGWPAQLGHRLGLRHIFNQAVGGTGFISGGGTNCPLTHTKRMQLVIDSKPDAVLIGGVHNDSGYTSPQRLAAFQTWYTAIRAGLPSALIVFFGSTPLRGEAYSPTLLAADSDIQTFVASAVAAGDSLIGYIPTADEAFARWVPDGTVGPNFWTSGDSHPSSHGIDFLAERYTAALCDYVTRIRRD